MASDPDVIESAPWPQRVSTKSYPYSLSIASTASSSSSSVFSIDAPSIQSSVSSSSAGWSSSVWNNENENPYFSSYHVPERTASASSSGAVVITSYAPCPSSRVQPPVEVIPSESRQNPRRTQRLNSYESQDGKVTVGCPRPPPSLVRQSERKDNFVDSLVGKLTCSNT